MLDHSDLSGLHAQSLKLQSWIREQTFSPEQKKTLRQFSSWEVAELILGINQSTFRGRLASDPSLPSGTVEENGRQHWFSLDEINELRQRLVLRGRSLMPFRPKGKRAIRSAIANFKGGAGKSTVALHFAHAAALNGYRVLLVDFDPQATLSHAMGVIDIREEFTVWGIMARDLLIETERMNTASQAADSGLNVPRYRTPAPLKDMGLEEMHPADFIVSTAWETIDIIPSCANAAFVEFASAQYRHLNPDWSFFGCVSRYLDQLRDDAYDLIIFDCPPAIGYQSMNAVFAADVLYIPSGPGYWEYDSTTSFIGQLSDALEELANGYEVTFPTGKVQLPKTFLDMRVLLTRFEPNNELHLAMQAAFSKVFHDRVTRHQIELTRAVEQSGRFLCSIYEIDYRKMTRETWKRARKSFDQAYDEFIGHLHDAWKKLPDGQESQI